MSDREIYQSSFTEIIPHLRNECADLKAQAPSLKFYSIINRTIESINFESLFHKLPPLASFRKRVC